MSIKNWLTCTIQNIEDSKHVRKKLSNRMNVKKMIRGNYLNFVSERILVNVLCLTFD